MTIDGRIIIYFISLHDIVMIVSFILVSILSLLHATSTLPSPPLPSTMSCHRLICHRIVNIHTHYMYWHLICHKESRDRSSAHGAGPVPTQSR